MFQPKSKNTSWSPVAKWYTGIVGDTGHYFHEHVILPNLKLLLNPKGGESVLDIGCGQGVYARTIPHNVDYTGIDISKDLIQEAKKLTKNAKQVYYVADATKGLPVPADSFDHAVCILAIQNMKDGEGTILNVGGALKKGGDFVIVMNHPSFRIPRQSSWGKDEAQKLEYRRVNRYLSPLEIPINAHPGLSDSPMTWTYHQPLSYYVKALKQAGLLVSDIEEWTSDKVSVGKSAKGENRARSEFPLFLAIRAVKA
ncbi:class I SAM-dependent methyltransferase [Candidatus Woesebacteria bacterium]|nr:class I SAM-dependent methyltransferase [Candidatus Woesebacteria bacterium]